MVSPPKQIFHCFGCGAGGGVIQFLMLMEKTTFVEAIEILAKRLGMDIPAQQSEKKEAKAYLYDVVNEASMFFHNNLLRGKNSEPALQYLDNRGINRDTIEKFRLGLASGSSTLLNYMREKGYTLDALEKASLAICKNNAYRDLFWDRIIFPIYDIRCRVVGFGARTYKKSNDSPKYINSIENLLYSKREHLFGLNLSKDEVVSKDNVFVVEGYLDMITPFMHGIRNIVASLGTALTLEQIKLIRRFTSNITLLFDADKAGQAATLRALDLLLENDMKVKIVSLIPGNDPDSLIRKEGKDYFLSLAEKRKDFFDYKLDILKTIHDAESIEGKTKIVKELLDTINKLNSEVEKYGYINKLAESLGIKEEILIAEYRKNFSKSEIRNFVQKRIDISKKEILPLYEKVIIKSMLTIDKSFAVIKKNLVPEDFSSLQAKAAIGYFLKNCSEEKNMPPSKLLKITDNREISEFVCGILMDENIIIDKEYFKSSLLHLRGKRFKKDRERLKQELKEAEKTGDREKARSLIDKLNSEVQNG